VSEGIETSAGKGLTHLNASSWCNSCWVECSRSWGPARSRRDVGYSHQVCRINLPFSRCIIDKLHTPGSEEVRDYHIQRRLWSADGPTAAGTNLQYPQCPPGVNKDKCMAAYLALHLTKNSSAYLEVRFSVIQWWTSLPKRIKGDMGLASRSWSGWKQRSTDQHLWRARYSLRVERPCLDGRYRWVP